MQREATHHTDDHEERDQSVRRLQQQLTELSRRAQRVRAGGTEFQQISEMLDEVVQTLQGELRTQAAREPCSHKVWTPLNRLH